MCGIAGAFQYQGREGIDRYTLSNMLACIGHRGPDDWGLLLCRGLGIGMRRLSIIDIDGGKQPISNEDGTITIVFNGEIYNYSELREMLSGKGHIFKTSSDTEVIVHLYEDLGEDCVKELRGMFGFAIWDSARQRLFIARDRLGIKPLYYADCGGSLESALQNQSHPAASGGSALVGFGWAGPFSIVKVRARARDDVSRHPLSPAGSHSYVRPKRNRHPIVLAAFLRRQSHESPKRGSLR